MTADLAVDAAAAEPFLEHVRQAQEAERLRAAREIHDRLGYWMGLAHVELELYELYLNRDLSRAGAHLTITRQAVAEGLAEIRRLVTDLRSQRPVDCLEKALHLVADTATPAATTTQILFNGDDRLLPAHLRAELFLVLREAMRNAFSHAEPPTVTVLVDISPTHVLATVIDDGTGFDPDRTVRAGGISSMRERITLLDGTLSIASAPGHGCAVKILLPR